ncbi:MAG: hypothetical protein JNK58_11050 [Phycisphaerae bacterium]|nr:hypothetical protein [Phycisphaerae bacterium]
MRPIAMIGLLAGAIASSAHAETYTFPHTFEIAGRLVNSPLGSVEIPYQAMQSLGDITITPGIAPPTAFEYHYEDVPAFSVGLEGSRTNFAVLLTDGRGNCDSDADDDSLWHLTMEYRPVALIGGVEYRMARNGTVSFSRPHSDPQPLPIGGGEEELRHGAPVVFLFESAITLWAEGDEMSGSFLTIDPASKIVIEESIPAPAGGLVSLLAVASLNRRRRN